MSVLGIAASGLQVQQLVMSVSANNIANLLTDGFRASRVVPAAAPGGGVVARVEPSTTPAPVVPVGGELVVGSNTDLVQEIVSQVSAAAAYRANLSVIRTADQMAGALLDTFA